MRKKLKEFKEHSTWYYLGLLVSLVTFDIGVKEVVEEFMNLGECRETILDGVELRKVHNSGFSGNVLDKKPEVVKNLSLATLLGLLLADIKVFLTPGKWIKKFGMSLLSAGAISNVGERVFRGYVVDYIGYQFKWDKIRKLTANLADFYLLLGGIIVSITSKLRKRSL